MIYKSIVNTPYGDCYIKKFYSHKNEIPLITSAINKTEYFINKSKELWGDIFEYNKTIYQKGNKNVIITCKIHGDFNTRASQHINKRHTGCPECAKSRINADRRLTTQIFIDRSLAKHGNKYNYSKVVYLNENYKVKIVCPLHGEFMQSPKEHSNGKGCYKCGRVNISKARRNSPTGWKYTRWVESAKKSKNFHNFKVYIIKCYNDEESFIKIGKTYQSLQRRFRTKNMLPYKYTIINEITGEGKYICNLESILKTKSKSYAYIPKKKFNGMYECFNETLLNDKEIISAIPK